MFYFLEILEIQIQESILQFFVNYIKIDETNSIYIKTAG